MISLIAFLLASICNSIMDTVSHHHPRSIFKNYEKGFWSDAEIESWKNKYVDWDGGNHSYKKVKILFFSVTLHPAFTDAWHFFKSLMIVLICISIVSFKMIVVYDLNSSFLTLLVTFVIYGIVWNCGFNVFYNHILKTKKA